MDLDDLKQAITDKTLLVSIMAANNEIGVLQPLAEIGRMCHERGVLFHTDAAQATGKIPLDVEAMQIDLLSIAGHKMYAPKGIGALYVRRRGTAVELDPHYGWRRPRGRAALRNAECAGDCGSGQSLRDLPPGDAGGIAASCGSARPA